jgi:predicted metal-dependent hydrolase
LRAIERHPDEYKVTVVELREEVRRWAREIGVKPARVQVQRMTTKWASCSRRGRICLSKDLLSKDAAFREVVIVHELLHLIVPNHGKLFRSLLSAYRPGWDRQEGVGARRLCGSDRG